MQKKVSQPLIAYSQKLAAEVRVVQNSGFHNLLHGIQPKLGILLQRAMAGITRSRRTGLISLR